ncbi:helix-turn-helix transcriptional regulator [Rhodococcus sp. 06-156-3C]|nr:helix-turn-helix transcriptional regulator [Rhodococcus sp. 06-156-4C]OZD18955.1 helix-turn-helix transcriptional regulator [Rhodococcus sp. 06-156-3C]OZD22468.1 helix-turn-helix transcriptional regulator [Rhodococcus sp. 06-156-4a]OZD34169.1 helix-turn-helix transcriptional regulator [Rhodococcus sp. 06-156-3b]OZD38906.1 helix-turn-helix transcriptional regulator [Rhodococcus sp. 06-156-3]OZF57366.1 helix-turn-helix transcriptional regulator [Rhodococcus sp. 06-156-4]
MEALRNVVSGPLVDIARRFSSWTASRYPHTALIIFTRECTGRPRKVSGDSAIVDHVSIKELDDLKDHQFRGGDRTLDGVVTLAGSARRVAALLDDATDTLLVIVPKPTATTFDTASDVAAAFGIVATSIRHQVVQASPAYLAESLAASSERARAISEMVDVHVDTLTSVLSTLRSKDLDDRRARETASNTASVALVQLRSIEEANRELAQEAVTTAFARLRGELAPLLGQSSITVEYVDPPADGRPVPGEVARAARAVVRTVALAYAADSDVKRIRIAWDCDGTNLLLEVRNDGRRELGTDALAQQLSGRVHTLRGFITFESTAGWGSRVSITIPLDPPAARPDEQLLAGLNPREREVLGYLAIGKRNKDIASNLGIGESTVKFHVASILKKLDVTTRGEAGALGMEAGMRAGADTVVPTPSNSTIVVPRGTTMDPARPCSIHGTGRHSSGAP